MDMQQFNELIERIDKLIAALEKVAGVPKPAAPAAAPQAEQGDM